MTKLDVTSSLVCQISQNIPVKCYKIVDLNVDGSWSILFHGVNGTRKIPLDAWMQAERKWAGEGGRKYWTGFHVFIKKEIAEKYYKKFTDKKKNRVIIRCFALRMQPKESSRGNVYLAEAMMVPTKQDP